MNAPARRLCLLAVTPWLLATGAVAADLEGPPPARRTSEVYPAPRTFDLTPWTGVYVGLSLGRSWGTVGVEELGTAYDFDTSGTQFGAYAGYTWQAGRLVFGLEGDIATGTIGANSAHATTPVETDLNWMIAARGRAGFLITPSFYLYGLAGVAWANFDLNTPAAEQAHTFFGYQVGLGAEWRMSTNWSLRFDYIYTDLEPATKDYPGLRNSYDLDLHTVRAGLSFRF